MRVVVNVEGPVLVVEAGGSRLVVEGYAEVEEFFEAISEARQRYEFGLEQADMSVGGFDA